MKFYVEVLTDGSIVVQKTPPLRTGIHFGVLEAESERELRASDDFWFFENMAKAAEQKYRVAESIKDEEKENEKLFPEIHVGGYVHQGYQIVARIKGKVIFNLPDWEAKILAEKILGEYDSIYRGED